MLLASSPLLYPSCSFRLAPSPCAIVLALSLVQLPRFDLLALCTALLLSRRIVSDGSVPHFLSRRIRFNFFLLFSLASSHYLVLFLSPSFAFSFAPSCLSGFNDLFQITMKPSLAD